MTTCKKGFYGKGRYVFYLGGWAGASEGRVISKILTNWGGPNLFISQKGEGYTFFPARKNFLTRNNL